MSYPCSSCGGQMSEHSQEGLCPRCLLLNLLRKRATRDLSRSGKTTVTISVTPSDLTGVRLQYFGDYELLEEIARGGMGVVYRARQMSLNRIVAVKMILSGHLATELDVKRFRTEAEAAANLQHPNIVAIHEVGVHEGQHYFSMDYIPGKNLAELIGVHGVAPTEAAKLIRTIGEAIHFAHQRGILHRDLKPQNVLIDSAGEPHITDFGLAKRLDRQDALTQTGAIIGTPNYMAPEQAAGRIDRIGPHTDTYALGAILYHLLTGQPPFRAETPIGTLTKLQEEEVVTPTKLNRHVPTELEVICLKCLEKEPTRRYPSARALAEDLERLLNGEPVQAQAPSDSRRIILWFKRHPWVPTGAVLCLALGLVWLAYGLWVDNVALRWEAAHPGELRPADWVTRAANPASLIFVYLGFAAVQRLVTYPFEKKRRNRILTGKRISGTWLYTYGLLSLGLIVLAVYFGMKAIEFYAWDNQVMFKVQRKAEYQKWQELKTLHPDWQLGEPRGSSEKAGLIGVLMMVIVGAWSGASLMRKILKEYLFVMHQTAAEELWEKEMALSERKTGKDIFGIPQPNSKTVVRALAVGSCLSAIIIVVFATMEYRGSEWALYLVIPTAFALAGPFTMALVLLMSRQSYSWMIAKLLIMLGSFAGISYLFGHYTQNPELCWFGIAGGILCGLALGGQLRSTLERKRRV